jgi:hypothetical protein
MLFVSLICTGLLLLGTNLAMWRRNNGAAIVQCILWFFFPAFLAVLLPAHLKLTAALFVLILVLACIRRRERLFLPISLLIMIGIYGWQAISVIQENNRLTSMFPLVDMTARLPDRPKTEDSPNLLPITLTRLERFEQDLSSAEERWPTQSRRRIFRQLHEEAVMLFGSNPGFGVVRMPLIVSEWRLQEAMMQKEAPLQDYSELPPEPTASSWNVQLTEKVNESVDHLHDQGQREFLKPERYGYIKSIRQVAGFLSHQFNQVPQDTSLVLRRLDLISLLLHDKPVAYVTTQLPKMNELRDAPTRPLELFESTALNALSKGEDLVVNETEKAIWLVGALRASKQCMSCHDVKRGELLGAFSYVLERPEGTDRISLDNESKTAATKPGAVGGGSKGP